MADNPDARAAHPGERSNERPTDRMGERDMERDDRPKRLAGRAGQDQEPVDQDFNDPASRREIARLARDM